MKPNQTNRVSVVILDQQHKKVQSTTTHASNSWKLEKVEKIHRSIHGERLSTNSQCFGSECSLFCYAIIFFLLMLAA